MTRSARFTRGSATVEVLSDGRVLVTIAPAALPFGASVAATVLYPSLRSSLAAMRVHGVARAGTQRKPTQVDATSL